MVNFKKRLTKQKIEKKFVLMKFILLLIGLVTKGHYD